MTSCKTWMLLGLGVLGLGLAGCATGHAPVAEQTYCHKDMNQRKRVCTSGGVPSLAQDAEAKKFQPVAGAFVLYVVRKNPVDKHHRIGVSVNGQAPLETVPGSFLRIRVTPGAHRLSFVFEGQTYETTVVGRPGEIGFAGLVRSDFFGLEQSGWSDDPAGTLMIRTRHSRLVAEAVYP